MGDVRLYECPGCGGRVVRPPGYLPRPCDNCDQDLTIVVYVIRDHGALLAGWLGELHEAIEKRRPDAG